MTENENWHMDKRISYAHIVSTLLLLLAVAASASTFTARVAVLESTSKQHTQAIRDIRVDQATQYAELIRRLERMDNKLDQK